jgi:hypothetical protein
MNPFKFLAFTALGYFGLVVIFGSNPSHIDPPVVSIPQTVLLKPLTDEQIADRNAEIAQQIAEENATIYDEPVETTTTLPQLAKIDPDTKCQEWLPIAVEQGWPNETEVLETLGRVMWRESRCNPLAVNESSGDHGLTQINQLHQSWLAEMGWTLDDMAIPSSNLRFAFLLWNSREEQGLCGWQPWSISC